MKNLRLTLLILITGLYAFGQDCTNTLPNSGTITVSAGQVYCMTENFRGTVTVQNRGVLKICGDPHFEGSIANFGTIKVSGSRLNITGSFHDPYSKTQYNQNQSCSVCEDQTIQEVVSLCAGETYEFFDRTIDHSGVYEYFETTPGGCVITHILQVNYSKVLHYVSMDICDGSTFNWNNQVYEESGTYFGYFQNQNGCDSVVALTLNFFESPVTNISASICEGETYTWDGRTYTTEGLHTFTYSSVQGCDSVVTLNLEVNPVPNVSVEDKTKCSHMVAILNAGNDGADYLWNTGATTQEIRPYETGTFWVTVTNAFNCSTTDTTVVTNHPDPIVNLGPDVEICEGESATLTAGDHFWRYTWWHNGTIVDGPDFNSAFNASEAGVYVLALRDSNYCGSTDTINVEVNPTFNETFTAEICEGDAYDWDGRTYESAGNYAFSYQTVNGCDSTVTLNLDVNPTFNEEFSAEICDNEVYTWDGRTYETNGSFPHLYQTVKGCDSLVTLNLKVNPTFDETFTAEICEGDAYDWDGRTYESAGNYAFSYQTVNGCDSTVTLSLNVNPTYDYSIDTTICHDEVFTWNGYEVSETASVSHTFSTVDGCDSTVTFNVIQLEQYSENMGAQYLCGGDYTFTPSISGTNYLWNTSATGNSITVQNEGNYSVTFTDENGCSAEAFGSIVETYNTSNTNAITDNQPVQIVERFGGIWSSRTLENRTYSSSVAVHEGFLYVTNATINGSVVVEPDYNNNANIIVCGDVNINSSNGQGFALKNGGVLKVFGTLTLTSANELNGTVVMTQGAKLIINGSIPAHSNLNIQYVGGANCFAYVDADLNVTHDAITTDMSLVQNCSTLACPTDCGFEVKRFASEETSSEVVYSFDAAIFPNPTSGTIQLELENGAATSTSIMIFDMQGKLVISELIANNITTFDLSNLNTGMYQVVIQNNSDIINKKLMIQK